VPYQYSDIVDKLKVSLIYILQNPRVILVIELCIAIELYTKNVLLSILVSCKQIQLLRTSLQVSLVNILSLAFFNFVK